MIYSRNKSNVGMVRLLGMSYGSVNNSPDDFFFKCSGRCSTLVRVTISTPLAEKTLVSTPFIFSALSLRKPQMPLFCLQWMREPKDPYYRQMQDRH